MNSQTLPCNIFHNKIHFANYLNHSHSSDQNSNSYKFTSNIHKPNPIQLDQESAQGLTNFPITKKKKNERSKIEDQTSDIYWINSSTIHSEKRPKPTYLTYSNYIVSTPSQNEASPIAIYAKNKIIRELGCITLRKREKIIEYLKSLYVLDQIQRKTKPYKIKLKKKYQGKWQWGQGQSQVQLFPYPWHYYQM